MVEPIRFPVRPGLRVVEDAPPSKRDPVRYELQQVAAASECIAAAQMDLAATVRLFTQVATLPNIVEVVSDETLIGVLDAALHLLNLRGGSNADRAMRSVVEAWLQVNRSSHD